jgi:hypothetical protein
MMEALRVADWDQAGLAIAHALRSPWLGSLAVLLRLFGSAAWPRH